MCGLVINTKYPHLGTSPNGLIDEAGTIEIKCPGSTVWRDSSVYECCKDPTFYCAIDVKGEPSLKKSHLYYCQVQGQLALTLRK